MRIPKEGKKWNYESNIELKFVLKKKKKNLKGAHYIVSEKYSIFFLPWNKKRRGEEGGLEIIYKKVLMD